MSNSRTLKTSVVRQLLAMDVGADDDAGSHHKVDVLHQGDLRQRVPRYGGDVGYFPRLEAPASSSASTHRLSPKRLTGNALLLKCTDRL